MSMQKWWNDTDRENQSTCPSATLFLTNRTWTGFGSNPGFRRVRPVNNRLSHGAAETTKLTRTAFIEQFVPRSKHNPNALQKAISSVAREK